MHIAHVPRVVLAAELQAGPAGDIRRRAGGRVMGSTAEKIKKALDFYAEMRYLENT